MPKTPPVPRILLLIETAREYGRGLHQGIARYASEHGPWSMFCAERGLFDPLPPWVAKWRGDGILSRLCCLSHLTRIQTKELPLVELYADPDLGFPCVFPNLKRIADLAADHLVSLGLRTFAFFATEEAWWINTRRGDFVSALEARGYSCRVYVPKKKQPPQQQSIHEDVVQWLVSLPKPCGIFCASDLYAMHLLGICREHNILVPEEIAVLGVDNDPVLCGIAFPPLSSIDVASPAIGYAAAALLDRLMAGKKLESKITWVEPISVITRQSTDVVAIDNAEVAHAVRFIRERACRGVSVQDVADAVAISRRGLERRFLQHLHRSPAEEIMRVRLARAEVLLRQTDLTVDAISRKCDFSSPKYFSQVFREATGQSPRAFRKANRTPTLGHPG